MNPDNGSRRPDIQQVATARDGSVLIQALGNVVHISQRLLSFMDVTADARVAEAIFEPPPRYGEAVNEVISARNW